MGSGYVLNFTDPTYSRFFMDHRIDISDSKFQKYGTSKAKRMRAFWGIGTDIEVGQVLEALLTYVEAVKPKEAGGAVEENHRAIASRLLGHIPPVSARASTEREFLELEFGKLAISRLALTPNIEEAIRQRIGEIQQCLLANIALAVIFHSGSALEVFCWTRLLRLQSLSIQRRALL